MKVKIKKFEFDSSNLVSFSYRDKINLLDRLSLGYSQINIKLKYTKEQTISYSKKEQSAWRKDIEKLQSILNEKERKP